MRFIRKRVLPAGYECRSILQDEIDKAWEACYELTETLSDAGGIPEPGYFDRVMEAVVAFMEAAKGVLIHEDIPRD